MSADRRPAVVAYDGSKEAANAVRAAAALFADRELVIVTVWEPGLAMALAPATDPTGIGYMSPTAGEMAEIDRLQRDRAATEAQAGVDIAREHGAEAEAFPVADDADVPRTITEVAERRDASVIVVGSRGRGGAKARLLGSTSRKVLQHTHRPVLVVREPG